MLPSDAARTKGEPIGDGVWPALIVQGLSYSRGGADGLVLRDIRLELGPGLHALLGPNGSGKTTLLQCLAGVLAAEGSVRLELGGRSLSGRGLRALQGYSSQQFAFYEEMKVEAFLRYAAKMKLLPAKEAASRVEELLRVFGLHDVRRCTIRDCSTGQRRRLSIAQALLNRPRLLLLDEPLEGLDLEERGRVMGQLREHAEHSIVLMASHIFVEVEHWIDQAMFLCDGRLVGPRIVDHWLSSLLHSGMLTDTAAGGVKDPGLEDVYRWQVSKQ